MAHISISGVPSHLEQAALNWLNENVFPAGHTGNVVSDTGELRYGNADPSTAAPPPTDQVADQPADQTTDQPAPAQAPDAGQGQPAQ